MTSQPIVIGDIVYVPFWTILDSIDNAQYDAFQRATVVGMGIKRLNGTSGPVQFEYYDIEIKPNLYASVPANHVIPEHDLEVWAERIGSWFAGYPQRQISNPQEQLATSVELS